eukprot:scaffold134784_cov32-Tisochrysis_lutea.AAC.3
MPPCAGACVPGAAPRGSSHLARAGSVRVAADPRHRHRPAPPAPCRSNAARRTQNYSPGAGRLSGARRDRQLEWRNSVSGAWLDIHAHLLEKVADDVELSVARGIVERTPSRRLQPRASRRRRSLTLWVEVGNLYQPTERGQLAAASRPVDGEPSIPIRSVELGVLERAEYSCLACLRQLARAPPAAVRSRHRWRRAAHRAKPGKRGTCERDFSPVIV